MNNSPENEKKTDGCGSLPLATGSAAVAPDWHPLNHIDEFIFACGWTHDGYGFVPPEKWRDGIRLWHGGGLHWERKWAVVFCIQYHEQRGFVLPNTKARNAPESA